MEEVHEGRSEDAVRGELERRGFHILKIRTRGLPQIGVTWPSFTRSAKQVPDGMLLLFSQEFAALLRSGLPVLQSLEMMAGRQKEPAFKEILEDVCPKGPERFRALGGVCPPPGVLAAAVSCDSQGWREEAANSSR